MLRETHWKKSGLNMPWSHDPMVGETSIDGPGGKAPICQIFETRRWRRSHEVPDLRWEKGVERRWEDSGGWRELTWNDNDGIGGRCCMSFWFWKQFWWKMRKIPANGKEFTLCWHLLATGFRVWDLSVRAQVVNNARECLVSMTPCPPGVGCSRRSLTIACQWCICA